MVAKSTGFLPGVTTKVTQEKESTVPAPVEALGIAMVATKRRVRQASRRTSSRNEVRVEIADGISARAYRSRRANLLALVETQPVYTPDYGEAGLRRARLDCRIKNAAFASVLGRDETA